MFLEKKNRKKKFVFARDSFYHSVSNWNKVLFTDESKFNTFGLDGRMKKSECRDGIKKFTTFR
jgi:hypothetical protein